MMMTRLFTEKARHFALGLPRRLAPFFSVVLQKPHYSSTPPHPSLTLTSRDSSRGSGQPPLYSQSAPVERPVAVARQFGGGFSPSESTPPGGMLG